MPYFECKFEHLGVDEYLSLDECTTCMHKKKRRRGRCGCVNCLKEDCGACIDCIDMPKYGGPGIRKKRCKERKCCSNNDTKKKKSK